MVNLLPVHGGYRLRRRVASGMAWIA